MVKCTPIPMEQLLQDADDQFEDIIEQAFWEFDHLRNLCTNHELSERDKFKQALRRARTKVLDQ